MKIANIMCFARGYNAVEYQFSGTKLELETITALDVDHTFLLEYDALCMESYQKLFHEKATERTEIGLWLEIVEPLTTACGLPYRSEKGWKWDYHIIPGFLMGYTPREREMLVEDHYLWDICTTSDAIYENLPIVNTQLWFDHDEKKNCGLVLDSDAEAYTVEKVGEHSRKVAWKDKFVQFEEHRILDRRSSSV